jgi:predicted dehydrogenase
MTTTSTLRVAVIGVGAMGRNHARVFSDLPDVELVGVADSSEDAAKAVARRYGGKPYADHHRLLDEQKPDAVTIAVPTVNHLEVACAAAERGAHLLIEKPIAFTVEEGQQIIRAAARANVQLAIGHVERFNPAVVALKERVAGGELGRVFQIDARRQGPFPARVLDVGVVIDLAVHDLDIMRYVTGAEIMRVYAETEHHIHSAYEDSLSGLLRLDNGAIGTLMINWLTPTKIRELHITGERGMFRVDYLTQDLYFYENTAATAAASNGGWDTLRVLRGVSEGCMIRHALNKREPVRVELEAFVAAVRGEAPVRVTGYDGLRALELARAIVASGREHRTVEV